MKESEIISKLTPVAEEVCSAHQAFLVEIDVLAGNKKQIEIIVQSDEGINSGTVTLIAREINKQIETIEFFDGAYQIDVGSPGIGRPLKNIRALNSQTNRLIKVEFKKDLNRESVKGNLKSIAGSILTLEEKRKKETVTHLVDFNDTSEVTVDVEW